MRTRFVGDAPNVSPTSAAPTLCTVARYSATRSAKTVTDLVTWPFVFGAVVARDVGRRGVARAERML